MKAVREAILIYMSYEIAVKNYLIQLKSPSFEGLYHSFMLFSLAEVPQKLMLHHLHYQCTSQSS